MIKSFRVPLLLTAIFITLPSSVKSQAFPRDESGNIKYEHIATVENKNQEELYLSAREWLAKIFQEANSELQMDDKEASKIITKGSFNVSVKTFGKVYPAGVVEFIIDIETKDGRYKYTLDNFYYTGELGSGSLGGDKPKGAITKGQWNQVKQNAFTEINVIILTLRHGMLSKEEEW